MMTQQQPQEVKIIREPVKLRLPPQGPGFFNSFYALFRGRGVMINSDKNLFAAVNSFFTATSVLYLGCESGDHIEAAVLSSTVQNLEAVCSDPMKSNLSAWGQALTRSLSQVAGIKNPSNFRIEFPDNVEKVIRDRDLVIHHIDDLFPPAPTEDSVTSLKRFLTDAHASISRIQFGGFYIIAAPSSYIGIDLLLSAIVATTSTDKPLIYDGMILYGRDTPLWIFRIEPLNWSHIESQRTMATSRLLRYPPILQKTILDTMNQSSQIGSGVDTSFNSVISSRVTPTDTVGGLFRTMRISSPLEVINRLGNFQPKYSTAIDKIRGIPDLKIKTRMVIELLYDIALASQRKCSSSSPPLPIVVPPARFYDSS